MGGRTLSWRFIKCFVVRAGLRRILPVIGRFNRGLQAIERGHLKEIRPNAELIPAQVYLHLRPKAEGLREADQSQQRSPISLSIV